MTYIIKKILNTNAVVVTRDGLEMIAFGKGIGYKQKINTVITKEQISKKFIPENAYKESELIALLEKIPAVYFEVTRQIIEYAEVILKVKLKASIYYTLTDHLYFAVERFNEGMALGNRIYWEMKTYYKTEFMIEQYGLDVLKKETGYDLPKEEAANITFHIINANPKVHNNNILEVSRLVDNIIQTLRVLTKGDLKQEGLNFERFVTHIKFFSERYLADKMLSDDQQLLEQVFNIYPQATKIALKLEKMLYALYERQVTKEELAYLIIHIHRLLMYG